MMSSMNHFGLKMADALLFACLLLYCCASGGLSQTAAENKSSADTPATLIKELYRVHRQGRGPIFTGKSKVYLQKFFDKRLADLLWKVLTANPGEVGPLDFDPLYNAQDFQITNFRIGAPVGDDKKSVVTVTFRNAGQSETIKFRLNHMAAGWKVENIVYSDKSDLIKILSSPQ